MKKITTAYINSETLQSVKSDVKRIEDDPEAILRLVDLIFFYIAEKSAIYSCAKPEKIDT